jgi:hypothetical protein
LVGRKMASRKRISIAVHKTYIVSLTNPWFSHPQISWPWIKYILIIFNLSNVQLIFNCTKESVYIIRNTTTFYNSELDIHSWLLAFVVVKGPENNQETD